VSLAGAILGFLALEPSSGYTLKQRFDGSVGSFWSATQSQIYRELHALEREGWVEVEALPGDGKPDRKVYSLTRRGHEELERWLEEPLEPLVLRHPLLLKFVFAADVPPDALDERLARYARGVAETRAEYAARLGDPQIFSLARSDRERELWRVAIEHGLAWCDMELGWIERARKVASRGTKGSRKWTRRKK
jgi:DNA-binding PadR family transcriptional regulator